MKTLLVVSSLVTVSSLAGAEPSATARVQEPAVSPGYIAVGAQVDSTLALDTGYTIDAGYRLGASPWLVHGQFGRGDAADLSEAIGGSTSMYSGESRWTKLRAGIEHDSCNDSDIACAFAGVDVGVLHTGNTTGPYTNSVSASYTDELITPNAGVDFGFHHVHYRMTLGLDLGVAQRTTIDGTTSYATAGLDFGGGVMYRF